MRSILDPTHLAAAVVYSGLGIVVFSLSFAVIDKLTPYDLWQELIAKQNRALGTVVAGMSVALGIIIAASMVG